jgi:arylsulfatase A-like enzyme
MNLRAIVLTALLLTALTAQADEDKGSATRPNILFILADDLGWTDLGCTGSKFHQTPNIDKLAARGTWFTQAYAANPLCSPTRSSILTGLWPARTGITAPACHVPEVILEKRLSPGNPNARVLVANSVTRLSTDYITLPKVLKEAGYRTGHFGKWHLGAEPYSALQHGFDEDWPHWPGPGPGGSYVAPWAEKFPIKGQPGEHIEDTLSQQVVRFIRENKDRPFFANYWSFSVHSPYDAKPELVEKYRKLADPKNAQRNPVYAAMVESLDDGVGRVLAALDECGIADRTIIVFFSDNGGISWGGEGSKLLKSAKFPDDMNTPPTSNLPLRNGKASLYEGGVREPCFVVWPGVTQPGTTNDNVIQSIDWMPTLLEMTGVSPPETFKPDGISIVPALRGEALQREAIFTHFPHDTAASGQHPGTTVRRGDWKLHRLYAGNDDGTDLFELYNLQSDLGETTNLAKENPELVQELNQLIDSFLKKTDAVIPKLNPNFRKSTTSKAVANDPLKGWVARSCEAVAGQDCLTVSGTGPNPFLGFAAGGAKGPGSITIRLRAKDGGRGKIEWIPPGATPAESRSVEYQFSADDWQEVRVDLPADALLGILRLHLPAQNQPVDVDWIDLQSASKPRRWDF